MTDRDILAAVDDGVLLPLLGGDRKKLEASRSALVRWRAARPPAPPASGLPAYQA